ncbi:hypothetical protein ACOKM5_20695 [Streptomyces sp. BH097]|uniref:hypothetical protein n=1 Tax=Streptomyces sp. BH097 TaxID=3410406 RepID=UPI003CED5609
MAEIKRCREPFAIEVDGITRVIAAGALVSTDDPAYTRGTRAHFDDVTVHVDTETSRRAAAAGGPVEEATAAPGELRDLTPPTEPDGGDPFAPDAHTAPEVLDYLKEADDAERERVLAAEAAGRNRKSVLGAGAE